MKTKISILLIVSSLYFGCNKTETVSTPPTVKIQSPLANASISMATQKVDIVVYAKDNIGVSKVDARLDTTILGTSFVSYSDPINSNEYYLNRQVSFAGLKSQKKMYLVATATNSKGLVASDTISFFITP